MRNGSVECRKIKCVDGWNFRKSTRIEISRKSL